MKQPAGEYRVFKRQQKPTSLVHYCWNVARQPTKIPGNEYAWLSNSLENNVLFLNFVIVHIKREV